MRAPLEVGVCANCHRMLPRMEGKAGDIKKLKALVAMHYRQNHHPKKIHLYAAAKHTHQHAG